MRINKIVLLSLVVLFSMIFSIFGLAQRIVTIGTDPVDSGTYAATAGLSNIINMYNKSGIMLKVKPTTGPMDTSGLMATGELELVSMSQYNARDSWLTKGDMQIYDKINKVNPTRLLFGSIFDYIGAFTIDGTGILTGADIKGKKFVGIITSSPKSTKEALGFLANWGLTEDDVKMISVASLVDVTKVVLEGRADVSGQGSLAGADMVELDAVKGVRFLSLNTDPEALKAYEDIFGVFSWVWVDPHPVLTGVRERTAMLIMRDYCMCNPNLISDEEAYAIIEALWDHMDLVTAINADFTFFMKPEMLLVEESLVPYHPGAIKFFKEKGIWTQAEEDKQAELLALEAEEMK